MTIEETIEHISEWFNNLSESNQIKFLNKTRVDPRLVKGYKLYHIPTGLYYRPRGSKNPDLDFTGKVYSRIPYPPYSSYIYFSGVEKKKEKKELRNILINKFPIIEGGKSIAEEGFIAEHYPIPKTDWKVIQVY